ncbi:MAG TPA: DNA polymerase III subunit [Candidatus Limnocylindrales bacterium]|nr:DNA polymerase III subunit [Candidatus Limnocylindrales bacterium]
MRDVIGQRRILERLGAQALRGDVAQGYELSGPRSIGKHTVALRLAQTLNCEAEPRVSGGCGVCLSCRKIDHGTHPDLLVVTRLVDQIEQRGEKKGEAKRDRKLITIEQIREMQMALALRPLEGRKRVVIIDDAADLSEHAEVALLKTLEEPPSHAVLLLITPTPSRLLETIRSRVQPMPFRLVARPEIESALRDRFGDTAARFAAVAAGRPGVALTLAADESARAARTTLEREFYTLVSSRLTDRFAWAADLAESHRDTQKRNEDIEARLVEWGELLRDAAVTAIGAPERATRPEQSARTERLAASVPARELIDIAQSFERWRRDVVETTVSARMLLELLALKLPYREDVVNAS